MNKIAIIGARGIPAKYGGFETFAEELSVALVQKYDYDVLVVCDGDQAIANDKMSQYKGVKLRYSQYSKRKNALRYYRDSLKIASDYTFVYSCGPGVGVSGPLARRQKQKLITNTDGLNWKRAKWNPLIQQGFKIFEWLSCRYSEYISCDSKSLEDYIRKTYKHTNTFVAEYGAYKNQFLNKNEGIDILSRYNIEPNKYHLVVSRLEPENNVLPIIQGYTAEKRKYPLVVVGNLQDSKYCRLLQESANEQVKFVGGVYEKDVLQAIRAYAISYLHGHSVGGTNPSLLEALGSKNLCVCHDNVFNREVTQNNALYFTNANSVKQIISTIEESPFSQANQLKRELALSRMEEYYNWKIIVDKYNGFFQTIFQQKH